MVIWDTTRKKRILWHFSSVIRGMDLKRVDKKGKIQIILLYFKVVNFMCQLTGEKNNVQIIGKFIFIV